MSTWKEKLADVSVWELFLYLLLIGIALTLLELATGWPIKEAVLGFLGDLVGIFGEFIGAVVQGVQGGVGE